MCVCGHVTYVCYGGWDIHGTFKNTKITFCLVDPPEIITEESYVQTQDGVQLELVCIVHASPKADVRWFKDGLYLESNSSFIHNDTTDDDSLEDEHRLTIRHNGRKHVLIIRGIEDEDRGHYTCHAMNSIGEGKGNIQVMGKSELKTRKLE